MTGNLLIPKLSRQNSKKRFQDENKTQHYDKKKLRV